MSYRSSRARREFEAQLKLAVEELGPLYKLASKQGSGSRLLAAYYIFAYSQLEVYIKSLIEDSVQTLNAAGPPFSQWPDLMLGYLLHRTESLSAEYRRFGFNDDEGAILEKVGQTARKVAAWSMGSTSLTPVYSSDFLDKKKYPSPKNLPQLFRRLGIKSLWAVVGKAGKTNCELILTSLNDLRTNIAHEGKIPPGFSLGDFRNSVDQMKRFVAAMDRGVSTHFCANLIQRTFWNSAMS